MGEAIYLLNALWFKKDGGMQKYMEYGAAVGPLLEKAGAKVQENFAPEASLIGEWNPDVFFVVKYPSQASFESMISSAAYAEIMHLREEALENSMLIRCKEFEWS